jgi:aspartyl protease family protein
MAMGFMETYRGRRNARRASAVWLLLAFLLSAAPGGAGAAEVQVVGLFGDKALVRIDGGRPTLISVGQSIGTVRLISANSESAVLEVDGKRRSLGVGSQAITGNYASSGKPTVVLNADLGGHYYAEGSINGGPIRFMVDTGASMISIGQSDARRLGIQYLSGERGMSNTANGLAPVYHVKLGEVRLGAITLRNVDGLVHENNDMPFALLGMSFLNRVDMKHSGQQLTLTRRF